ncbi:MAG: GGDEF domain-containing protein [Gammaproteobacteria bacterium]|nr:GGDEF domain-containing protein [Gammaproteobacteria bacterium]
MSILAYIELSIQGRQQWVILWFGGICAVLSARYYLLCKYQKIENKKYFPHLIWRNRFYLGVVITGLMQGGGAAWLMPYVTINLEIILHSVLLGLSMGAIAYLSTSLLVYISYLLTMVVPVTLWLFLQQTPDGYILTALYIFMITVGSMSVKRMNVLLNDALYYRFDNETLVEDLQKLLDSVSRSNKALEKISTTDELTGVSNYRAFRVRLEEVWREYQTTTSPISVIRLNIDYYHEYNIAYGQELGDKNLCMIANLLLAEITHQSQTVARLNGAEFALILPGMSCENARLLILRVEKELAELQIEHCKSKTNQYLTFSAGLSSQLSTPMTSSRELLGKTDNALKLAKNKGRNRIEVIE